MRTEEVLKIKDVAALLKVGEKTVYSMAQSAEIPAFKVRGQWRFSRNDVEAWIEQQKHPVPNYNNDEAKSASSPINGVSMKKEKKKPTENTIPVGYILDYISGRQVKETSKELVRQRVVRALIHEYGFSPEDREW